LQRAATPPTRVPEGVRELLGLRRLASVSSWTTFARDVELHPSCGSRAELQNVPLFEPAAVPARLFTGCFVFRAGPKSATGVTDGRVGIALAGSPAQIAAIAASGLVGPRIDA